MIQDSGQEPPPAEDLRPYQSITTDTAELARAYHFLEFKGSLTKLLASGTPTGKLLASR